MPLEILLVLVVGGIAGIAGALHLLGLSARPALNADAARAGWLRHFPDDAVVAVTPAASGLAALIETETGHGLVWRFGADTVARRLPCQSIETDIVGLKVRFDDFGSPWVKLRLTADEQTQWKERMDAA